jgi:hypothetical protein
MDVRNMMMHMSLWGITLSGISLHAAMPQQMPTRDVMSLPQDMAEEDSRVQLSPEEFKKMNRSNMLAQVLQVRIAAELTKDIEAANLNEAKKFAQDRAEQFFMNMVPLAIARNHTTDPRIEETWNKLIPEWEKETEKWKKVLHKYADEPEVVCFVKAPHAWRTILPYMLVDKPKEIQNSLREEAAKQKLEKATTEKTTNS